MLTLNYTDGGEKVFENNLLSRPAAAPQGPKSSRPKRLLRYGKSIKAKNEIVPNYIETIVLKG
jgi:hypothetical protein